MRSTILVNMKKNEIIIKINEESPQEAIIEALEKKMVVLKKLYKEAKNPIRVMGKFLKEKEMQEIEDVIKKEIDVNINFDNVNQLGSYAFLMPYKPN